MNKKLEWGMCHFRQDNQKLWFCDSENNTYSFLDLNTGKCGIDIFLSTEHNEKEWRQYGAVAEYGNKLVFAPENTNAILIYDKDISQMEFLLLDEKRLRCHEGIYRFCGITIWEHFAYFIPCNCTVIVRVDLETMKLKYIDQWYRESKADASQWTFCRFECRVNELCFLPFTFLNKVLCFNLKTEKYQIYEIKSVAGGFSSIHYDGQFFWLAALFKPIIYRWSFSNGTIKEYVIDMGEKAINGGFLRILSQDNKLILVPLEENFIIYFHKENETWEKALDLPEGEYQIGVDRYFSVIDICGDNMLAGFSPARKCVMKIYLGTGEIVEYPALYGEEDSVKIKEKNYQWQRNKNYGICFESKILDLNELIHIADNSGNDILKETQQFHTEDAGNVSKNIFEYLKKHIS